MKLTSIFALPYKPFSTWGYLVYFWSIGEPIDVTYKRMIEEGFPTPLRTIKVAYEAMDIDLDLGLRWSKF